MSATATGSVPPRRVPVPRGLARSGPVLLSYGFRPFFLAAGLYALLAMALWVASLSFGWPLGGDYGAVGWHGHEMLFGYGSAALGGFILTAVPNWTGRLPVSGRPLLVLFLSWVLGRAGMLAMPLIGPVVGAALDAIFLPLLAAIVAREIFAGRNWKNLKVLVGISALALANLWFHFAVIALGDWLAPSRGGVAIYAALMALVGGRIIPSFTSNWLARQGGKRLAPIPGPFDMAAIGVLVLALAVWTVLPDGMVTALLAALAGGLHLVRLARWRGWATIEEPLLLALHLGYLCLALGCVAVAASALGVIAPASALHVLTVGAIGLMTLAVMTRASRGHTGRLLSASLPTALSYLALFAAAVMRPLAELVPEAYHLLLAVSGACWMLAFGLFVFEYLPILTSRPVERR